MDWALLLEMKIGCSLVGAGPRADERGPHGLLLRVTMMGALGVLSGCCLFSPRPPKCDLPPVVIDAHTHLFNANYLPVREILAAKFVDRETAAALERLILAMTGNSELPAGGNVNRALSTRETGVSKDDLLRWADLPEEQVRAEIIERFIQPVAQPGLLAPADRQRLRAFGTGQPFTTASDRDLTAEEIARLLEEVALLEDRHGPESDILARGSAIGYLRFFAVMISSERKVFGALERSYPDVSLFVHHMMEMEKTYGGQKPTIAFPEQVRKMLALQRENPGKILTFGAFDPFRRNDALALAEEQWASGVIGFKFYPPSGYRPAENRIPTVEELETPVEHWNSRYQNLGNAELDAINDAFFAWCAKRDVPIFLHCTPVGFEASANYGRWMCDPEYWCSVLEKYPNLRVCFGHAGGSGLFFGHSPSGTGYHNLSAKYGRTIAELCRRYPNVYCEAGFWEEILKPDGPAALKTELRALFREFPKLKQRLVYGTDWFMLVQEKRAVHYLCQMAAAFDDPELDRVAPYYFGANMARFLKLDELSQSDRLDRPTQEAMQRLTGKLPADWRSPDL